MTLRDAPLRLSCAQRTALLALCLVHHHFCRSVVCNLAVSALHLQQLSTFAKIPIEPFSHGTDEVQAVKKVLAGSRSMDLPQMLRPMLPDERAAWLALHGVPHIVQVQHSLLRPLS